MTTLHHHLCKKSNLYHRWHQHPLHRHVHWGLLGAVVLGVALSFVMLGWSEVEIASVQVARAQSSSCTHTVAKDGSGNFTTIQEAADAVTAGNVVCVKQGTYPGFHIIDKHGRPDAWIVFRPAPGHEKKVIIDSAQPGSPAYRAIETSGSSYLEINGFEVTDSSSSGTTQPPQGGSSGRDGIKLNPAYSPYADPHHIRIISNHIYHTGDIAILGGGRYIEFLNNHIEDIGGYGIYFSGNNNVFRGNRIHNVLGFGLHLYPTPWRNTIEQNLLYDVKDYIWSQGGVTRLNRGDGMILGWSGGYNVVRNNIVYHNTAWGIRVGSSDTLIVNNTTYGNGFNGIYLYAGEENVVIRNNLSFGSRSEYGLPGEVYLGAGTNIIQDHNSWNLNLTDPKFVNAANGDFRLQSGSPAIDAGTPVTQWDRTASHNPSEGVTEDIVREGFAIDFEGTPRPQGAAWDIGADEFGAGTGSVCGRNGCEAGETASSCPQDCGSTQNQPPRNLVLRYLGPTPTGGIPATNCGNGTIQTGEQCDGANLNGQTCQTLGFQSGTPACYPAGSANQCTFNTSGCTSGPQCTPTAEVCDSKDNDCDSYIDEGNVCQPQGGHVRAFPTAEGYGALAKGGRGGRVIEVTNLNDSGPGSLREAVTATGPRIVVFRVGGTIELQSDLIIRGEELAYLTIAGQTAPGGGILLKKYGLHVMDTHDIIIRHLRIRTGFWSDGGASHGILVWGYEGAAHDVIFDHVSVSWIMDDNSIWGNTRDVTLQWSMFAEASTQGRNEYDCGSSGGCGLMWGPIEKVNHLSIHHNLLIHNYYRNPGMGGGEHQFINNVIYNPGWSATIMGQYGQAYPINIDFIGNYYQKGPDTRSGVNEILFEEVHDASIIGLHLEDNFGWNYDPNDPYALVQQRDYGKRTAPLAPGPFVPITIHGYEEAKDLVIQNVGATMPVRDAVDIRLVDEFNTGIGSLGIGSDFPMIANGAPPADSDHDGMPDAWETSHGLNPTNASDGPQDQDSDGYTNVEEYLNELAGD